MKGYVANIEKLTMANTDFRRVLYTAPHSQLVLMSLMPSEEIGEETHGELDQFFRIESGVGKAVIDGVEYEISDGSAVVIPAGTKHNIINQSQVEPLRLYTIYSPADHKDGTVHPTKMDAMEDKGDHFDGKLSE